MRSLMVGRVGASCTAFCLMTAAIGLQATAGQFEPWNWVAAGMWAAALGILALALLPASRALSGRWHAGPGSNKHGSS